MFFSKFSKANWKIEEVIPNHKFDDVYLEDFKRHDLVIKIKYILVYVTVIRFIVVYLADIWIGIFLMVDNKIASTQPKISLDVSKLIYVVCLFTSLLLLAWDWKKSKAIIDSGDIFYAYTNPIAFRYHSLKSYLRHCFICNISMKHTFVDKVASFVFFGSKGWKRLILIEAPLQIINAITLYSIANANATNNSFDYNTVDRISIGLISFTLLNFFTKASFSAIAFMSYSLLKLRINENLREQYCHKVNQRIDELLEGQQRNRDLKQQKVAQIVKKYEGFARLKKSLKIDNNILNGPKNNLFDDDDDSPPVQLKGTISPESISLPIDDFNGVRTERNSSNPLSRPFPINIKGKKKSPNSSSPYSPPYPLAPTPRISCSSIPCSSTMHLPPPMPSYHLSIDSRSTHLNPSYNSIHRSPSQEISYDSDVYEDDDGLW
ncbi:19967_t:CDS:2 [Funneliformis geosporum]|uniref:17203_t:CDS:1 n=1 Tax=Funneliformis geosporum TaxID=1117311 RepID=A0A9W4SIA0_9GLOM|nr:17203_t:CDS:2 [Funneliformis geosporum]CAI2176860.1 19967_t:CDS:2 [Funneliformis geosporum]